MMQHNISFRVPLVVLSMLLNLAACGGGGGSGGSEVLLTPPVANPPPPPPSLAPLLPEALDCIDVPASAVVEGTEFKRVTLADEDAICNDGSRAVMYVRSANTLAGEQHWFLNFQGGGSCTGAECAPRWCESQGRMSTVSAPEGADFEGLFSQSADNNRPDANQVFLYYCSSDNFAGRRSDVVIEETSETPEFRIHFRGATILESAMRTLESGAVADDESTSLPALGGTGLFTISGTSAGCGAVARQADRLATRVQALGYTTQVLCDGNFAPDTAFLPDDARKDAVVAGFQSLAEARSSSHDALRDESCLALQTEAPWRCDVTSFVLANHIVESPVFVRMDLGDPTVSQPYLENGYTQQEFADGVRQGLLAASAGAGVEAPVTAPSVYGPACGRHVALFSRNAYFSTTIANGTVATSLNEAIAIAASGTPLALVDNVPPSLTTCGD